MAAQWGAVLTAMVTPFRSDLSVDYERAQELAVRLVASGTTALVVAGTTGESPTLSTQEKVRLWEAVVEAVKGRAAVIAGTGTNATAESVALTRRAEAVGVDAVMLVCPYYNKPSQEGLYQHFRTVAASTRLPVMLYNIPGRTASNLLPATAGRLARDVPNIVALKDAAGSLDQTTESLRAVPETFTVYCGDDSLTLPMLAVGARGVVSVASHVAGPQLAEMIAMHGRGDGEGAARVHRRLFPLFRALFVTSNPVPVKAALDMLGFPVGGTRPPLAAPSASELATIRDALAEAGLL